MFRDFLTDIENGDTTQYLSTQYGEEYEDEADGEDDFEDIDDFEDEDHDVEIEDEEIDSDLEDSIDSVQDDEEEKDDADDMTDDDEEHEDEDEDNILDRFEDYCKPPLQRLLGDFPLRPSNVSLLLYAILDTPVGIPYPFAFIKRETKTT